MITLASIVHDPSGKLLQSTLDYLPKIKGIYSEVCLVATSDTDVRLLGLLVESTRLDIQPKNGIGKPRRDCIMMAESDFIHYCDFDRILYWSRHYPAELGYAIAYIQHYDFTILERTKRAFLTHPKFQRDTEIEANKAGSLLFNRPVDFLSGSRGISRKARDIILTSSKARGAGIDLEWSLIAKRGGLSIGYLICEGLEYESDYFGIRRDDRAELLNRMDNLREILDFA